MIKRLQKLLVALVCSALLWSAGGVAEASTFMLAPDTSALTTYRAFLRNQHQMNLETQALALLPVSTGAMADVDLHMRPYFGRLVQRYQIPTDLPLLKPLHPHLPWLTWMDATAIVTITATALASWLGLIPHSHSGVMQACGVFGLRFVLAATMLVRSLNPGVIPALEKKIFRAMNEITVDRGEHESGEFVRLPDGTFSAAPEEDDEDVSARIGSEPDGYRFVGAKVVKIKRENMPELLEKEMDKVLTKDAKKHGDIPLSSSVLVTAQDRYSTWGDPTDPDEAHPHAGERPDSKTRIANHYRIRKGKWEAKKIPMDLMIAHNGDFDDFAWWYGEQANIPPITQSEARQRLVDILETPNELQGDSPTIAMFMSLMRTQGDAFASVRYAFQRAIPWDNQSRLPTRQELKVWGAMLELAFQQVAPEIVTRDITDLSQITNGHRQLIIDRFVQLMEDAAKVNPGILGPLASGKKENVGVITFANHAINVFLDNDAFTAVREFAPRAKGSFGLSVTTTVDSDPVFYASQQTFYLGRDRTNGRQGWNSERRALAVQVQDDHGEWVWAFQDRLAIDRQGKEVVRLRADGTADVFSVQKDQFVDPAEVEKRWVHMPSSRFIKPVRVNGNEKKPLKVMISEAAAQWKAMQDDWADPHSYNRLTEGAFAKLFVDLAEREVKAKKRWEEEQARRIQQGEAAEEAPSTFLGPDTHVLLTGYHLDYKHAEQFGEFLGELFPSLNIKWIHPNTNWLEEDSDEMARKYRITPDTIVIAISRSGGAEFPMNMLADLRTRVKNIFAVTGGEHGDLDSVIAGMLGQAYGPNDPLACRVFTNGQPRPRRQALVGNHMATTQTMNYMAMGVVRALRQAHVSSEPLGLSYTEEEMNAVQSYNAAMETAITRLTGADAQMASVVSSEHDTITRNAERESKDFREIQVNEWLYRGMVLLPILFIANEFHKMPHNLIPWLSSPIRVLDMSRGFFDVVLIILVCSLIAANVRWLRNTKAGKRFGPRVSTWVQRLYALPMLFVLREAVLFLLHPGRLFLSQTIHIPVAAILGMSRALFDLEVLIALSPVIFYVLRLKRGSQTAARIQKRTLALVSRTVHYFGFAYFTLLLAQQYPKAGAIVRSAHTSGEATSDYLHDVVPGLVRGDLSLVEQEDERLAFEGPKITGNKNAGAQTRVNRSIRSGHYVLIVNEWLKWLSNLIGIKKLRIEFGHARVITFLRNAATHHPNVEDDFIVLETHYFPFPRPIDKFFDGLEKKGVHVTVDQRATFFAARRRFESTPILLADPGAVGGILAKEMNLDAADRDVFQNYFRDHGKATYSLVESVEETARQKRLEYWVVKRLHSIEYYLAWVVWGEAFVDPIANPIVPGQDFQAGDSHPGTLIDTTAAPSPMSPSVLERIQKFYSMLSNISVPANGNSSASQPPAAPTVTPVVGRPGAARLGALLWRIGAIVYSVLLLAGIGEILRFLVRHEPVPKSVLLAFGALNLGVLIAGHVRRRAILRRAA